MNEEYNFKQQVTGIPNSERLKFLFDVENASQI
jgi:hypothetical protein